MSKTLEKSCLVFGYSGGIGKSFTKLLLEEGFVVKGIGRSTPDRFNSNFSFSHCDLSSAESVDSLISMVDFARYSNLVYLSGFNRICSHADIDYSIIRSMFDVNLFSAMLVISAFCKARANLKTKSAVLSIGSIWSSYGRPGRGIYGATKAGLAAFSKHLSSEVASQNILINTLSPGFVDTPLTAKTIHSQDMPFLMRRTSKGDLISPDDIAKFSLELLVPNNRVITGQEIFIDDGFTSHA